MLTNDGKICEMEKPPWCEPKNGHRILCHIPPEELRKIVLKTLEKDPGDRYETAKPLRAALDPIREQYPVDDEELTTIFEVPSLTTRKIPVVKPGSTQSRINESFGLSTTPPPGAESDPDADLETSGTIESGSSPDGGKGSKDAALQARARSATVRVRVSAAAENYNAAVISPLTYLAIYDIDDAPFNATVERVVSADGTRLVAWWLPAEGAPGPATTPAPSNGCASRLGCAV